MNKSIEIQAKTIEAAIEEALAELDASYEQVDVDIIQEAGLFKKAKVRVTMKDSETHETSAKEKECTRQKEQTHQKQQTKTENPAPAKEKSFKEIKEVKDEKKQSTDIPQKLRVTLDFVKKLLGLLENPAEVTYEISERAFNININGTGVGQLIGRGGDVLNALQTIIGGIAIKNSGGENRRVYINIEDYKQRREQTLHELAVRKAEKVRETGRYIKLEPMNARDRAIIHTALQGIAGIRTYSTGKDPHRCLCIAPERKDDVNYASSNSDADADANPNANSNANPDTANSFS